MAVISELIEKAELELRDKKAKKAGFIIALSGELYIQSVGINSAVYIERIGGGWESGEKHSCRARNNKLIIK
ncbi:MULTISPECIES: hypothetical protein [Bacillaceae]|uniref:hypothetical protein n=1 Tax=Bacillaceae TaxID=186817 RepID=UPI002FFE892B